MVERYPSEIYPPTNSLPTRLALIPISHYPVTHPLWAGCCTEVKLCGSKLGTNLLCWLDIFLANGMSLVYHSG